jgi:hypothetical protein
MKTISQLYNILINYLLTQIYLFMKNLELNPEFNLLGQIDLNSVKIALDRDEMEEIVGGYGGGGGSACAEASIGLAIAYAGAFFVGASTGGAAMFLVGFVYASYGMHNCR